jgi:hypothetical protein
MKALRLGVSFLTGDDSVGLVQQLLAMPPTDSPPPPPAAPAPDAAPPKQDSRLPWLALPWVALGALLSPHRAKSRRSPAQGHHARRK